VTCPDCGGEIAPVRVAGEAAPVLYICTGDSECRWRGSAPPEGDPESEVDVDAENAMADAIGGIVSAILDPGPHPLHHDEVVARHRAEWPVLWTHLDALVSNLTAQSDKSA
jgi:hypothetical protein